MATAFAATVLVLLAGPKEERDVVWCKDGRKLTGIIRSETDTRIVLLQLFEGRKGATSGTAGVAIPKADIRRIDRMPDAARQRLLARADAFGDRTLDRMESLAKIRPVAVRFQNMEGLRTEGTHFEVLSTCDEEFVREVTYYLEEIFGAYKRNFDVRRNAERRVRVYLFADREEYLGFQQRTFGGAVQNPAFYHVKGNFIACFSLVRKEEAARIGKRIRELEREAQEFKDKVKAAEKKVRDQARDGRRKVNAEAASATRKIRRDAGGDKAKRLRRVESWKRQQLAQWKEWERNAKKSLDKQTDEADAFVAKNRKVVANNRRILATQNRRMFELLFHEGYHAFSRNFLWPGGMPRWLEEGLATYYEMSAIEVGDLIHGAAHPGFVALLKKHLKSGKPLRLERLVGAGAAKFLVAHGGDADRANLHYALSWAVAHYMADRVPRARLVGYVVATRRGADPVKAFEALMGKTVAEVEAELRAHLARLE